MWSSFRRKYSQRVRLSLLGTLYANTGTFRRHSGIYPALSTHNPYGEEEIMAATEVIRSGCLSSFIGAWGEGFLGGPQVRGFEAEWAEFLALNMPSVLIL